MICQRCAPLASMQRGNNDASLTCRSYNQYRPVNALHVCPALLPLVVCRQITRRITRRTLVSYSAAPDRVGNTRLTAAGLTCLSMLLAQLDIAATDCLRCGHFGSSCVLTLHHNTEKRCWQSKISTRVRSVRSISSTTNGMFTAATSGR